MKKGHQEMMWLFLKVSFLIAIIGISSHEGSFAAEKVGSQDESYFQNRDRLNLNDRMSKLEDENRQQKQEMVAMKATIDENRKEIENLNDRVTTIEQSEKNGNQENDDIAVHSRPKRPFRLIPAEPPSLKGKNEFEEDSIPKRFYGPPTNCNELQKIWYTLNGYYLIKGNDKLAINRIQVVYCQFDQPSGKNKIGFETWIGNVEVKSKSVHFYVQRRTKYPGNSENGLITFDVEQLNVGGAMNLTTGEFTAPVDGIYHFEFKCLKDQVPFESIVYLQKRAKDPNNKRVPSPYAVAKKDPVVAGTMMSNLSYYSTGSLTASLKLKTSDVMNLYSRSKRGYLFDSVSHYTQFTGWLVEEDLILV